MTWAHTYRVPLPPKGSGSNARGRWTKSRAAKEYRAECADAYRAQGVPPAPLVSATLNIEMRVCRRQPRVRRVMTVQQMADVARYQAHYRTTDAVSVLDACKAAIDALQPERTTARSHAAGAGIVEDDRRITIGSVRLVEVADFDQEGVWLEVQG